MKLDRFTECYLIAALWSSTDDNDEPLDNNYCIDDLSIEAINRAKKDCEEFQSKAGPMLDTMTADQAGYDFWLTRNRHGVGFWEADHCTEEIGEKLTDLSYSTRSSFLGDDKKLYFQ